MEYSVDPELMRRETEQAKQDAQEQRPLCIVTDADFHITSIQGDEEAEEEGYCLIETQPQEASFPMGLDDAGTARLDVNALASKLATLEGAAGGGGRETGPERDEEERRRLSTGSSKVGRSEATEVILEGGGVHTVQVTVEKHGTAVAWEFSTEPKGIAFGIGYKESKTSTREDEVGTN